MVSTYGPFLSQFESLYSGKSKHIANKNKVNMP